MLNVQHSQKNTWRNFLVLALLFVAAIGNTFAQEKTSDQMTPEMVATIRTANEKCFVCHSEAGVKNPPKSAPADMDLVKLRTMLHDPVAFNGSNHGLMECAKCHGTGYDAFPHEVEAKTNLSPCEECHARKVLKAEMQFNDSVHAISDSVKEKFTCTTCHSPHVDLIASKLIDPARIVEQDNHGCLQCHDSDEKFAKFAPADEKTSLLKKRPSIDEIHEWLPNTRAHWKAVRCIDCHTPAGKVLSHEIQDKEKAEKNCVACHSLNSSLTTRLYRHLAVEEQQKYGFANSIVLANSYVPGATRNVLLDTLLGLAFAAMLLGLVIHGIGRFVAHLMQRRKK